MNTQKKIENLMNSASELIPYLHITASYNRFQAILRQILKILKQNASLKSNDNDVWEIDNVVWWQNDN